MPLDIITYSKLKKKANLINGIVPDNELPDYVDVVEGYFDNGTFYTDALLTHMLSPKQGKLYIDKTFSSDNIYNVYMYSGSAYIPIWSADLSVEDVIIENPEELTE